MSDADTTAWRQRAERCDDRNRILFETIARLRAELARRDEQIAAVRALVDEASLGHHFVHTKDLDESPRRRCLMSAKSPHVEIYERWREWRWRFRASNGKILSQSSEGYNDPRDLVRGLELSFPGWDMRDPALGFDGYGGWFLWDRDADLATAIPVRVPEGTTKLWRARRKR